MGELRIYVAPTSYTPQAGVFPSSPAQLVLQIEGTNDTWMPFGVNFCGAVGESYRVIFSYYAPVHSWIFPELLAVDRISVWSAHSYSHPSLTHVSNLPYTESGSFTTCGLGDNFRATAPACGSLGLSPGEDKVWTFIAPASGDVTLSVPGFRSLCLV